MARRDTHLTDRSPAAVLALLVTAACGARGLARPPVPERAPSNEAGASARTPPAAAPPVGPAAGSPPSPDVAAEPAGAEAENEECTLRKNSGVVSACERSKERFGRWEPSPADVLGALEVARGLCYCAGDLARPVNACMARAGTSRITVTVGKEDDATDCTLAITSASEGGRQWVKLGAVNRDLGTIYTVDGLVERKGDRFALYYLGFNGIPSDEQMAAASPEEKAITVELKRDWATLSKPLRAFFRRP
jgi:hypothetical protein